MPPQPRVMAPAARPHPRAPRRAQKPFGMREQSNYRVLLDPVTAQPAQPNCCVVPTLAGDCRRGISRDADQEDLQHLLEAEPGSSAQLVAMEKFDSVRGRPRGPGPRAVRCDPDFPCAN